MSKIIGYQEVFYPSGKLAGFIDRTFENDLEEPEILIKLPCGHKERFWMKGLTDLEYIRRAKHLKSLDLHN